MDKKKILIICSGFYPVNSPRSFRATELAKEFARQGHQVTVITPKNNQVHPNFEKEHQITIKDLGTPKWKSPDFGKSKMGYLLTRAAYRFLLLAFEYPSIELMFKVKKALRKENGYDLLISIAVPYPIHWGVACVWGKNNNPASVWVADCGDPYMGDQMDSFRKWFYFKYVEKWFMHKADYVTIPIEGARSAYYAEFHPKIKVIPQGFRFEYLPQADKAPNNPVPHFAYAGSFIPGKRDPTHFLKFLCTLTTDFKFYVYTQKPQLLEPFKAVLGEKLNIQPYMPREQLLAELVKMDFLVNFDNNAGTQLPSKLIDYAMIKRPVLNITSDLNTTIIHQFLNGDYSAKLDLGDVSKYNITRVAQQFLNLCS